MHLFLETAWLLLPLLGGGIAHGFAMKYGWTPWLARPIDGGRRWRGVRCLGDNKTWRGPVYLGLGAALTLGVQAMVSGNVGWMAAVYTLDTGILGWLLCGFALGFAAMLGELPNSFLKRRAGIQPGDGGGGSYAWFFYLYDQIDILLLLFPAWWLLGALTWPRALLAIVLVAVIHQLLSSIGYRIGMRKTPR